MKIQVYTSIVNNYDKPRNDILVFNEYTCGYRFNSKEDSVNLNSLIYKMFPHTFLDCDISIWLDGNIYLLVDPEKLIEEFLGDADIATWRHPLRDCVYIESSFNTPRLIGNKEKEGQIIQEQMEYYKKIGIPEHCGLAEPNVIIRRHNKIVERFNESWWAEITRWSYRDQLSFTIVAKRFPELRVNLIEGNVRNHPYFKYNSHLYN